MTQTPEICRPQVSFVIPAYNEESNIGETIGSIRKTFLSCGQDLNSIGFEIIVVDNGSSDRTIDISRGLGAATLCQPGITVGALRNRGAAVARGDVLVFLDADISLTPEWGSELPGLLGRLPQVGPFISGSRVHAPDRGSMVDRAWFASGGAGGSRYINSGHMIVPKSMFDKIGGFDERLVSGEDSEICERASAHGYEIRPALEMKVVHRGTPTTVREFFRRERWHGYGDFQSLRLMLKSKPAMLSLVNGFALVLLIPGVFLFPLVTVPAYLCFLLVLSASAALHRNGGALDRRLPSLVLLYGVYICARSLSLFDRICHAGSTRWR